MAPGTIWNQKPYCWVQSPLKYPSLLFQINTTMRRASTKPLISSLGSLLKSLTLMISWKSHVIFISILVLSDNLNSSSFIKPSQPNSDEVKK